MALDELVRPDCTAIEVVLKIGSRAEIMLDLDEKNGGPPCLCIQSGPIQVLLYPMGWVEFDEVTDCDLERAATSS